MLTRGEIAAHSVAFSHCSQLRGSLSRKAAVLTPTDSSRRLAAFWAQHTSLWVEGPNGSALSHHQVHMEMIWTGILALQDNFSQRALLRKVIWELAFGSEGPVFMPMTRGRCAGNRECCPSHPEQTQDLICSQSPPVLRCDRGPFLRAWMVLLALTLLPAMWYGASILPTRPPPEPQFP